jgi:hypothetical protein
MMFSGFCSDIDAFLAGAHRRGRVAGQFPQCNAAIADINRDGAVNNFDVDPVVICLAGAVRDL